MSVNNIWEVLFDDFIVGQAVSSVANGKPTKDVWGKFASLIVRKKWQGQGIARQLFETVPWEKEVFLEVREGNTPARTLYQKQGFKENGCRKGYYHAPTEDAIMMKREANEG